MSMKSRNEWVTKRTKREKKKKDRGIVDLMMIINHFFKDLAVWIDEMKDPKNTSYTIYKPSVLVFMGLLKNMNTTAKGWQPSPAGWQKPSRQRRNHHRKE